MPIAQKSAYFFSIRDIKTVLTNYRMLLVFFITAIGYGGTFVIYTYLSPILEQVLQFALHSSVIGLIVIFLVGLFMFMNVPGLQLYAVQLAEKYTPNATAMASALNISAFNIGIVIRSYVGGFIVAHHSLTATPIYASALVFIAAAVTGIWLYVEKRQAIAATCQQ